MFSRARKSNAITVKSYQLEEIELAHHADKSDRSWRVLTTKDPHIAGESNACHRMAVHGCRLLPQSLQYRLDMSLGRSGRVLHRHGGLETS